MTTNSKGSKQLLIAALCLAATAGSAFWTYRTQFAAPRFNVVLHRAIGRSLAQETARLLHEAGKVVIVSIELRDLPELKVQMDEFERALKQFPKVVLEKSYKLETDDKPKYSFGSGLSGRRYVRIVNKNPGADAIVSFIGAPSLTAEDVTQLKASPKVIVEARSADKLKKLFEQNLIQAAIVARFQFPTPIKGTPRNAQEWFDQRYQIVTTNNLAELPDGKEE